MRVKISAALLALGIFISGCSNQQQAVGKVDKNPYPTRECIQTMSRGAEIVPSETIDKIVAYKKKRVMYTYRNGKKIDTFKFSLGKNADKGNKVRAGDYRTPEGSYVIVRKKCDNRLYKSLMISYPNAADIARASKNGVSPGGYITIHGQPKWNADGRGDNYTLAHDWTEGCLAVPNKAMDRLWRAVQNGVKMEIHP